jgi:16S rRNA (adenine1518-N6/adenine1519-N6)-dimethyltransferase
VNYESPSAVRHVLQEYGIKLKKRWGQNFLINRGARKKIVQLIDPKKADTVWEIGPGLGALTVLLLNKAEKLFTFEIDRGIIRWLEDEFGGFPQLRVYQGDIMKTWTDVLKEQGMPDKVCGNLPYNSASAIILSFMKEGFLPLRMIFTVQRELALRMTAVPGTKDYSGFSILCQSMFKTELKGELKPGSFFPQPEVLSAIITMTPEKRIDSHEEKELFFRLVRAGFSSRRKTLKNNIKHAPDFEDVQKQRILDLLHGEYNIETLRAEELTVDEFLTLTHRLIS